MPTGDAGRRLSSMGVPTPEDSQCSANAAPFGPGLALASQLGVGRRAGRALSVSERRPPSEWTQLRLVDSGYQPDSEFDKSHLNLGT